jgi:pimeloyl-ACP methyl ester carboxylesterase
MAAQLTTHHLDVPGARLYYEVRGSGPLLLLFAQPMTSDAFGPLADALAVDHTVLTYDPHGLGRSTVADPSLPVTPDVQADDLAQLVDAVGGGPADVYGNSGGGVAALALAARHPGKVRTVVAHEPPVAELLPDAPQVRAAVDDIEDAYRSHGSGAAWGKFISLVVHRGPVPESGVPFVTWPPAGAASGGQDGQEAEAAPEPPPEPTAKQQADDALYFLRMLKPFTRYEPVLDALRGDQPRVVVAVGAASDGEVAQRSALALAERLGTAAVPLPGDHAGFLGDPEAFAEALRGVLAGGSVS